MLRHKCAWIVLVVACLMGLAAACTPETPGLAQLSDLAATGIAGTQYAKTLDAVVARTQTAAAPVFALPSQTPQPAAAPSASISAVPVGPCPEKKPGSEVYIYTSEGFCFLYPSDFIPRQPNEGIVDFVGPALDDGSGEVRAYITLKKSGPVDGQTLDEIMLNTWSQANSPYRSYNLQLGGRDAVAAEGLSFDEDGRQVMQMVFVQNTMVFVMTLSPYENQQPFSPAHTYVQRFWETAIPSFRFFE